MVVLLYIDMNILPAKEGFTIYTKQKCPYCIKAKLLLKTESPVLVECDDQLIDPSSRQLFLSFIEDLVGKSYQTFPMVFLNGQFLGGYAETKRYMKTNHAFADIDER
jgi:glutaredoxin